MTLNCDFGTNALVTRMARVFENVNTDGFYVAVRPQIGRQYSIRKKNLTKTHNIIYNTYKYPQGHTVSNIYQ